MRKCGRTNHRVWPAVRLLLLSPRRSLPAGQPLLSRRFDAGASPGATAACTPPRLADATTTALSVVGHRDTAAATLARAVRELDMRDLLRDVAAYDDAPPPSILPETECTTSGSRSRRGEHDTDRVATAPVRRRARAVCAMWQHRALPALVRFCGAQDRRTPGDAPGRARAMGHDGTDTGESTGGAAAAAAAAAESGGCTGSSSRDAAVQNTVTIPNYSVEDDCYDGDGTVYTNHDGNDCTEGDGSCSRIRASDGHTIDGNNDGNAEGAIGKFDQSLCLRRGRGLAQVGRVPEVSCAQIQRIWLDVLSLLHVMTRLTGRRYQSAFPAALVAALWLHVMPRLHQSHRLPPSPSRPNHTPVVSRAFGALRHAFARRLLDVSDLLEADVLAAAVVAVYRCGALGDDVVSSLSRAMLERWGRNRSDRPRDRTGYRMAVAPTSSANTSFLTTAAHSTRQTNHFPSATLHPYKHTNVSNNNNNNYHTTTTTTTSSSGSSNTNTVNSKDNSNCSNGNNTIDRDSDCMSIHDDDHSSTSRNATDSKESIGAANALDINSHARHATPHTLWGMGDGSWCDSSTGRPGTPFCPAAAVELALIFGSLDMPHHHCVHRVVHTLLLPSLTPTLSLAASSRGGAARHHDPPSPPACLAESGAHEIGFPAPTAMLTLTRCFVRYAVAGAPAHYLTVLWQQTARCGTVSLCTAMLQVFAPRRLDPSGYGHTHGDTRRTRRRGMSSDRHANRAWVTAVGLAEMQPLLDSVLTRIVELAQMTQTRRIGNQNDPCSRRTRTNTDSHDHWANTNDTVYNFGPVDNDDTGNRAIRRLANNGTANRDVSRHPSRCHFDKDDQIHTEVNVSNKDDVSDDIHRGDCGGGGVPTSTGERRACPSICTDAQVLHATSPRTTPDVPDESDTASTWLDCWMALCAVDESHHRSHHRSHGRPALWDVCHASVCDALMRQLVGSTGCPAWRATLLEYPPSTSVHDPSQTRRGGATRRSGVPLRRLAWALGASVRLGRRGHWHALHAVLLKHILSRATATTTAAPPATPTDGGGVAVAVVETVLRSACAMLPDCFACGRRTDAAAARCGGHGGVTLCAEEQEEEEEEEMSQTGVPLVEHTATAAAGTGEASRPTRTKRVEEEEASEADAALGMGAHMVQQRAPPKVDGEGRQEDVHGALAKADDAECHDEAAGAVVLWRHLRWTRDEYEAAVRLFGRHWRHLSPVGFVAGLCLASRSPPPPPLPSAPNDTAVYPSEAMWQAMCNHLTNIAASLSASCLARGILAAARAPIALDPIHLTRWFSRFTARRFVAALNVRTTAQLLFLLAGRPSLVESGLRNDEDDSSSHNHDSNNSDTMNRSINDNSKSNSNKNMISTNSSSSRVCQSPSLAESIRWDCALAKQILVRHMDATLRRMTSPDEPSCGDAPTRRAVVVAEMPRLVAALRHGDVFYSTLFVRLCRVALAYAAGEPPHVDPPRWSILLPAVHALSAECARHRSRPERDGNAPFHRLCDVVRRRLLEEESTVRVLRSQRRTVVDGVNAWAVCRVHDGPVFGLLLHCLTMALRTEAAMRGDESTGRRGEPLAATTDAAADADTVAHSARTPKRAGRTGDSAALDETEACVGCAEDDGGGGRVCVCAYNMRLVDDTVAALTPSAVAALLRVQLSARAAAAAAGQRLPEWTPPPSSLSPPACVESRLHAAMLRALARCANDLYPIDVVHLLPAFLRYFATWADGAADADREETGDGGGDGRRRRLLLHGAYDACRRLCLLMYGALDGAVECASGEWSAAAIAAHRAHWTPSIRASLAHPPASLFADILIALSGAQRLDPPLARACVHRVGTRRVCREELTVQQLVDVCLSMCMQLRPGRTPPDEGRDGVVAECHGAGEANGVGCEDSRTDAGRVTGGTAHTAETERGNMYTTADSRSNGSSCPLPPSPRCTGAARVNQPDGKRDDHHDGQTGVVGGTGTCDGARATRVGQRDDVTSRFAVVLSAIWHRTDQLSVRHIDALLRCLRYYYGGGVDADFVARLQAQRAVLCPSPPSARESGATMRRSRAVECGNDAVGGEDETDANATEMSAACLSEMMAE